jgi:hypothetical protein
MQERRNAAWNAATVLGIGSVAASAILDLFALATGANVPPSPLAAISWVCLAVGIGVGSLLTLGRVMRRRDWQGAGAGRQRRATVLALLGLGICLGVLMLRGHPEIPPDPPLLAAQIVAIAVMVFAWPVWRRTSTAAGAGTNQALPRG